MDLKKKKKLEQNLNKISIQVQKVADKKLLIFHKAARQSSLQREAI